MGDLPVMTGLWEAVHLPVHLTLVHQILVILILLGKETPARGHQLAAGLGVLDSKVSPEGMA